MTETVTAPAGLTPGRADRPLILGEAPSRSGDRFADVPLSGAVGQRLCELAGIPPEAGGSRYGRYYWPLRGRFELRNLLHRYPGPQGRGAALPTSLAQPAVDELRPQLAGRVVVLLGRRLADLFGVPSFFKWVEADDEAWFVAIPHPSGLNRMYDAPEAQRKARWTLQWAMAMATPAGIS